MKGADRAGWAAAIGAPVLVVVAMLILLIAFAWPASRTAPRDLPVALAGDPAAIARIQPVLASNGIDIREASSIDDAREAILDREVYGAIVLQDPPLVLTASAASPAVAQALPAAVAHALGVDAVPTEDVRPGPAEDPRGLGFTASILPLIITSIAAAGVLGTAIASTAGRVIGAVIFAVVGGIAAAAIIKSWFGSLDGDVLANAAVIATTLASITFALLGLMSVAGRVGLGIGAALMIVVGNPLSGATSAPEMLPEPWGAIGQLLPPGAGVTATRGVAFFDGAGTGTAWMVLALWIAAGVVLIGLAAVRERAAKPNRIGLPTEA